MTVKLEVLKEELERQRDEKGMQYIKARNLDLDAEAREIGKALSRAEGEGWVEKWGGNLATTWRIRL